MAASFEMPPLKGSSAIPWNEGPGLAPDDKINIHANFNNELRKFTNLRGRLQFRSPEDEVLLTGREPAPVKPQDQKSPASRMLNKSQKLDKKKKFDVQKLTESQRHLYMVMSSVTQNTSLRASAAQK